MGSLKRIIITGEVDYKDKLRNFILVFNMESQFTEIIKILDVEVEITAVAYGPFDNGHIMVGLNDGQLLAFDFLTLERLEKIQAFEDRQPIIRITFDPTHYIFVAGYSGGIAALSFGDFKMQYLYFEFAKEKYCTLQVMRQRRDLKEPTTNLCCY